MRMIHCHNDGCLWQYVLKDYKCQCGTNVFHDELDTDTGKMFGVCNGCGAVAGELKPEIRQARLQEGTWKEKAGPEVRKIFDVALMEKEAEDGLSAAEGISLLTSIAGKAFIPVEFEGNNSSAMGFISCEAEDALDYDLSGLKGFISDILNDMPKESADGIYAFNGLRIHLYR